MISNQGFRKVQRHGKAALIVSMTQQLRDLGVECGDKVYIAVEDVDGKKRIIIEGARQ